MPAASAFPLDALREHLPGLDGSDVALIDDGWDSRVYAAGAWIFRVPRRPEVEERLRAELALLDELGPTLPAPVPRYEVVVRDGATCAGYRRIPGRPLTPPGSESLARELGAFLSSVHRFPVERAIELGLPAGDWRGEMTDLLDEFATRVRPLLDPDERTLAQARFSAFLADDLAFDRTLVHADLGPEHVLVDERGRLAGVIDWTDARIGDPALDFAWLLHGPSLAFRDALVAGYGRRLDDAFRARAGFYHLLGPWHEVTYGLDTGRPELVASGLAGVRDRLR
jgi:aminoglycoside phosphotransferase (APT) family kinase protein